MRPRRIYVGADLERLFADYLTHMACRATEFGLPLTGQHPLLVNLQRPPLMSALREGTVRDETRALRARGVGPRDWTPHWFRHTHATALLLAGTPEWVVSRRLGHAHIQTTLDLYGRVRRTRHCEPPQTRRPTPHHARCLVSGVARCGHR
jgi:integrase